MSNPLNVGVGWSTHFARRGLRTPRKLTLAYRAPTFFAAPLVSAGNLLTFLDFDEELPRGSLDGSTDSRAESVDLFYLASHGSNSATAGYSALLHDLDWAVTGADLGRGGPAVAIFDTCDLVDFTQAGWKVPWQAAGESLRLVLGFGSAATLSPWSSKRARRFAELILADEPIGTSWNRAVHMHGSVGQTGSDLACAIGLGDDDAEAQWAVQDMRLSDLPAHRSSRAAKVYAEVCH